MAKAGWLEKREREREKRERERTSARQGGAGIWVSRPMARSLGDTAIATYFELRLCSHRKRGYALGDWLRFAERAVVLGGSERRLRQSLGASLGLLDLLLALSIALTLLGLALLLFGLSLLLTLAPLLLLLLEMLVDHHDTSGSLTLGRGDQVFARSKGRDTALPLEARPKDGEIVLSEQHHDLGFAKTAASEHQRASECTQDRGAIDIVSE